MPSRCVCNVPEAVGAGGGAPYAPPVLASILGPLSRHSLERGAHLTRVRVRVRVHICYHCNESE